MNISMKAIDVSQLEEYIERDSVPFATCVAKGEEVSKLLLLYLEKYCEQIEDRKGRTCFYCNIINPRKCRNMGYDTITLENGKTEKIEKFTLRKHPALNKFVVVSHLGSGKKMDSISMTKTVRLSVEDIKKQIHGEKSKKDIKKVS